MSSAEIVAVEKAEVNTADSVKGDKAVDEGRVLRFAKGTLAQASARHALVLPIISTSMPN